MTKSERLLPPLASLPSTTLLASRTKNRSGVLIGVFNFLRSLY
jgi:hypothetical protein